MVTEWKTVSTFLKNIIKDFKIKTMKRVSVNEYQIGLVFKKGVYQRMITAGNYWLCGEDVFVYDINKPFIPPIELNILLKDVALANALQVIEVGDNEIVLQYVNGLITQVLTAGRYTFWKNVLNYEFVKADISKIEITENINRTTLVNKLVLPYVRTYNIENYEKAVLFVDGKFAQTLQSGIYYWWKNNISIVVGKVDTRMQQVEINGQEILTKDKAALRINAWAQYKVVDIEKAILENKEYDKQLYIVFQLALREYIAGYGFDEMLEKKDAIAAHKATA